MAKKADETLSFIELLKKELKDDSIEITKLSDPSNSIERDPTGILILDWVCGGAGIPKGRWVEIFGQESSGKSLIATLICANAQKRGETVAWIDMERTADNNWFRRLGVDTESMLMFKPTSAEGAFKSIEALLDTGKVAYIVVDSVAAMASDSELEEEIGKPNMAVMARMLSNNLRRLTGKLDKTKTTVILINQLRSTMAVTKYAKQTTTTGGNAIPFYASLRLGVHKLTEAGSYLLDKNDDRCAHSIRIKAVKNKVGTPERVGQFMLIYDGGPDNRLALITLAKQKGYITQAGAMFNLDYNGQSISARGVEQMLRKISENPEIQQFLFDALKLPDCYRSMFERDTREVLMAAGLAELVELPEGERK